MDLLLPRRHFNAYIVKRRKPYHVLFWLLNDYCGFLIRRLLVPQNTRLEMEGMTFLRYELSFEVTLTPLMLSSNHQGFRGALPLMGCTKSLGAQTKAPTAQEFEPQCQPPQSNLFLLKASSPTCESMKFKFPANHQQAVSKIHHSPGCVVQAREIRTKFSGRK